MASPDHLSYRGVHRLDRRRRDVMRGGALGLEHHTALGPHGEEDRPTAPLLELPARPLGVLQRGDRRPGQQLGLRGAKPEVTLVEVNIGVVVGWAVDSGVMVHCSQTSDCC